MAQNSPPKILSWLRVFRRANAAHLGDRVRQKQEPRVVPSEKYAARRDSLLDGRRMITACFARALQRCTSRICRHFLLTFQVVIPISKTCNQLIASLKSRLRPRLGGLRLRGFS